jgi:hypothetical protein
MRASEALRALRPAAIASRNLPRSPTARRRQSAAARYARATDCSICAASAIGQDEKVSPVVGLIE